MTKYTSVPFVLEGDGNGSKSAYITEIQKNIDQNNTNLTLKGGYKITVPCPSTVGTESMQQTACEASVAANKALLNSRVSSMYDNVGGKPGKTKKSKRNRNKSRRKSRQKKTRKYKKKMKGGG
tara:strand:+ start:30820 stop:31188 length:369 start_codon:yes stop_codon:yes gene_type:complete